MERDHESRLTTRVYIAKGSDTGKVLKTLTLIDEIPANAIHGKIKLSERVLGENYEVDLTDTIHGIYRKNRGLAISGIKLLGDAEDGENRRNLQHTDPMAKITAAGMALFKDGKLTAWLSDSGARGVAMVNNKLKSTIVMLLQLLCHPTILRSRMVYTGLAPAATFIFLPSETPEQIEAGLNWLMKRKDEWNIRIVLNLLVPNTREMGSMKKTNEDPWVKAFNASIEAGLLVIAANGNSKAHNNLHPLDFFTIGGYEDCGTSDPTYHKPHPSVPIGWNGDGYLRPDILAPFTRLPVPCFNNEK